MASEGKQIKAMGCTGWQYLVKDVIWDIEHNASDYWIAAGGRQPDLTVAKLPNGQRYVKTQADGVEPKSFLALPQ